MVAVSAQSDATRLFMLPGLHGFGMSGKKEGWADKRCAYVINAPEISGATNILTENPFSAAPA